MSSPNLLRVRFGEAKVLNLAFGNQVFHGARYVLDRDLGIRPMLVEKIDRVHPKAAERLFCDLADAGRFTIRLRRSWLAFGSRVPAKLGPDHDATLEGLKGFSHQKLVSEWPVHFCCIEEVHAS